MTEQRSGWVAIRLKLDSWWDLTISSDPGLNRLRTALQAALSVGVALAVTYGFTQLVHPYWISVPRAVHLSPALAAKLQAQHHGLTVEMLVLGGVVTLIAQLALMDARPRDQTLTYAGFPVALSSGAALGIWLHPHQAVGLVALALVSGAGAYARRFVPRLGMRAAGWGSVLFPGYLLGFLGGESIPMHEFYWLVAVVSLVSAVDLALILAVYNPLAATAVPLLRRSFASRARSVLTAAGSLVAAGDPGERERQARRLERGLDRLNQNALLTDGQLADPRSRIPADRAQALHEGLFDSEIMLQRIGCGAAELAPRQLDDSVRAQAAGWLSELSSGSARAAASWLARDDREPAGPGPDQRRDELVRCLAELCVAEEQAINDRRTRAVHALPAGQRLDDIYGSPIVLIGGNLVGSSRAGAAAVASDTSRLAARLHLDSAAQAAIRVALAVGAAAAVGSAISERRYYWAVIAAIVAYFGTNTAGEQVLKAARRVGGTVVGIMLGSLLAHAVGPTTWTLAVIIPAVTLAAYFVSVDYAVATVGITIVVSQLYVQFGEYSNDLLLKRLEMTTVGAVIAAAVAVLVFPVATRSALRQAVAAYLTALGNLLEQLRDNRADSSPEPSLTIESRKLDDALAQLLATARPLTLTRFRRGEIESNLALLERGAHYARNLVATSRAAPPLSPAAQEQLTAALDGELEMVGSLAATIDGSRANGSTPAPERHPLSEGELAVAPNDGAHIEQWRVLRQLDGTLTQLANNLSRPGDPKSSVPCDASSPNGL